MKRGICHTVLAGGILLSLAPTCKADVYVHGYTRKDGTYVAPHYRSDPDGNFNNNWSTAGNVNPYTGEVGTKTSPDSSGVDVYLSSTVSLPSAEERQRQLQQAGDALAKQEEQARQQTEAQTKQYNEQLQKQQEQTRAQIAELQRQQAQINDDREKAEREFQQQFNDTTSSRSQSSGDVDSSGESATGETQPFYGESGEEVSVPDPVALSSNLQTEPTNKVTDESDPSSSDVQSQTDEKTTGESDDSTASENDKQMSVHPTWWDKAVSFLKGLFN